MVEKETGQQTKRKRNLPCNECRFHRRKCIRPNNRVSCERCIRLKRECITASSGMDGDDSSSTDQDSMTDVNPTTVTTYNEQLKDMSNQLQILEMALLDAKVVAKIAYPMYDSGSSEESSSRSSSPPSYYSTELSVSETGSVAKKRRKTLQENELRDPIILTMTKNGLTLETNIKNIDDLLSFGLQALQYLDGSSLYTKPGVDMRTLNLITTSRTSNILWSFREALRKKKAPRAIVPQVTSAILFDAENVITNLVNAFFTCYNGFHPLLHQPSYYKRYHNKENLTEAPLTAAICAIMSTRPCMHIQYDRYELRNMGEYFFHIARDSLSDILDDTSRQTESSIGFLILSHYSFFTLRFSEARKYSSTAYLIAHNAVGSITDVKLNLADPEQVIMKRNYFFLNLQEMALKHFMENSTEFLDTAMFETNLEILPEDGELAKVFLGISNRILKLFKSKALMRIMEKIHDAHSGKVTEFSIEAFFDLQTLIDVFWKDLPLEERIFDDPYEVERLEGGYELFQSTADMLCLFMFHQFQLSVHSCFIPNEQTFAKEDQTSAYSMYTNAIHNQAMRVCLDSSKAIISMSRRVTELEDVCKFDRDFLLGVLEALAVLTNCPDKCVAHEARIYLQTCFTMLRETLFQDMVSIPNTLTIGHKPDSEYIDIPQSESCPSPATIIMWESMVRSLAQLGIRAE